MKFDKYNLSHYFIFLFSILLLLIALPTKLFQNQKSEKAVVLYGHKLYGNLKSIYLKKLEINSEVFFLTLDKKYYLKLKEENVDLLYGLNLNDVIKLVNCKIFICDHGLHFYKLLIIFKNIIFIDTNHGIPYHKDALNGINYFSKFDEVWLMSEYHNKLFETFDYKGENTKVTGYGRLDNLVQFANKNSLEKDEIILELKNKYSLISEKIILLAPTWVHEPKILQNKNYPFNKIDFFKELDLMAKKNNFLLIYRPHMNDYVPKEIISYLNDSENIRLREFKKFTNAEDFLKISDILITDWSSIALDYIVLDRPVFFLDVPNPFKDGALDDEILRFGEKIFQSQLNTKLEIYINDIDLYFQNNEYQKKIKYKIHDIGLDGKSVNRYLDTINEYLV